MEVRGRDEFLTDLWAWQREVLRALERMERLLSRLPVPVVAGDRPLTLPGPREDPVGYREPPVDLAESPSRVYVTLDMPGVDEEAIDLMVMEGLLTVRVDTPRQRYYREVSLPSGLDLDGVEATYRNGVLDIAIPRRGEG